MSWWQSTWFIARKDLKYMLRHREALLWIFVMPILFMFFIGSTTGGFGDSMRRPAAITVEVPDDAGFLADQLRRRLEDEGLAPRVAADTDSTVAVADDDRDAEPPRRLMVLPPAFTDSVLAGRRTRVEFTSRSEGESADYDRIRVMRAVYMVVGDLAIIGASGRTPSATGFDSLRAVPRNLTLTTSRAGRIPSGFEQTVPGTLTMFTLLVLLTSGAIMLFIERQEGLLRRLASSPVPRSSVVTGKLIGRLALGIVQIAFAMLVGSLLFHMTWGPDLPMLFALLLGWAALCAALGLLLGTFARSAGQAIGIGVLASNLLAALGGCWWPIEVTPRWMQKFALALPTGWIMDALHELVSFGSGAAAVVPHLAVMLLATVVLVWVASRTFRFT